MKQAELKESGRQLGPVGAQLVAETIIGLAWYDHFAYLFQAPRWQTGDEEITGLDRSLDMAALIRFVDS